MRLHKTCEWCGCSFVARERRQTTCQYACFYSRRLDRRLERVVTARAVAASSAQGWSTRAVRTPLLGWCVEATVPGISRPLFLVDDEDVRYLAAEVSHLRSETTSSPSTVTPQPVHDCHGEAIA